MSQVGSDSDDDLDMKNQSQKSGTKWICRVVPFFLIGSRSGFCSVVDSHLTSSVPEKRSDHHLPSPWSVFLIMWKSVCYDVGRARNI